ncbi:hypothetical protein GX408_06760 [bacterium]|nr:hypothetical protein [bacterium]
MKKYSPYLFSTPALLIAVISFFFHYTPAIRDAVSQLPAQGFDLNISWWRVLFEPFFGPLIFLLRSTEPISLYGALFIWVLVLALVGGWKKQTSVSLNLKRWLRTWPLYFGCAIALFLIAVFAPLPGETMVNQRPEVVLVNLHSHSHYSHDGIISPKGQLAWHRRQGFDAFFLTEHNHFAKTLEIVDQQRNGRLPAHPLIMAGMEYSGSNHIVLLGLHRVFNAKDYSDKAAIDSAHSQGGAAIVAHWFIPARHTRPLSFYVDAGADGFEIVNKSEGAFHLESKAQPVIALCHEQGLVMTAACDYHGYGNVCQSWTGLTLPGWRALNVQQREKAILEILRSRQQDKITVLVLNDRPAGLFPIWLRPVQFFFHYAATLNLIQVLSWFFWTVLAASLVRFSHGRLLARLGLLSGVLMIVAGCYMVLMGLQLRGFNELYFETSPYFIGLGLCVLAASARYRKKN